MIGYTYNNLLYVPIYKNASTTYQKFLENAGWKFVQLCTDEINLSEYLIWGHISDPDTRYTKGLAEYLKQNLDINKLSNTNPEIGKILVSGMFDQHCFSIPMLLGKLITQPIYWIPIDVKVKDFRNKNRPYGQLASSNDFTNDFFKEQGLDLTITNNDWLYVSSDSGTDVIRKKVEVWKNLYRTNYEQMAANLLSEDRFVYNKVKVAFDKKYMDNTP